MAYQDGIDLYQDFLVDTIPCRFTSQPQMNDLSERIYPYLKYNSIAFKRPHLCAEFRFDRKGSSLVYVSETKPEEFIPKPFSPNRPALLFVQTIDCYHFVLSIRCCFVCSQQFYFLSKPKHL